MWNTAKLIASIKLAFVWTKNSISGSLMILFRFDAEIIWKVENLVLYKLLIKGKRQMKSALKLFYEMPAVKNTLHVYHIQNLLTGISCANAMKMKWNILDSDRFLEQGSRTRKDWRQRKTTTLFFSFNSSLYGTLEAPFKKLASFW